MLRGEPGAPAVRKLIEQAIKGEVTLLMSQINLGEVIYHTERKHGVRQAQETLVEIEALPIQMIEATRRRVLDAAHLKANHRISYADAFAVALAQEHEAALVTGDPEFRALGQIIEVQWLAQAQDTSE